VQIPHAELVRRSLLCVALALKGSGLHGMYVGPYSGAWSAAADLSAQLNILSVALAYRRVLSMAAPIYDDLWTAVKAVYETEPVVADGGEVTVYAPHITVISYTHGRLIDEVGRHVRDYFLKQWDPFKRVPGGILAHSTHVRGQGAFDAAGGIETPRLQVTLATGIPEERCRRVALEYADHRTIDPQEWLGREAEGVLVVPHAGEILYRSASLFRVQEPA
jgi:nickel-dependent lactate racemase